jgi:hypothetical protein
MAADCRQRTACWRRTDAWAAFRIRGRVGTAGSDLHCRATSEEAAAPVGSDGADVSVVRQAQVHHSVTQGLITPAITMYLAKGVCPYVGDGLKRRRAAPIARQSGCERVLMLIAAR